MMQLVMSSSREPFSLKKNRLTGAQSERSCGFTTYENICIARHGFKAEKCTSAKF